MEWLGYDLPTDVKVLLKRQGWSNKHSTHCFSMFLHFCHSGMNEESRETDEGM